MSTPEEIGWALGRLDRIEQVVVMHCVTQYPVHSKQANLRCVSSLAELFPGHAIGYSDHTVGNIACQVAVALGATAVEKHFTLSRHLPGTDHICSMLPEELAELCGAIEQIEDMLGCGNKRPLPQELEIRDIARNRFKDNWPA